MDLNMKGMIFMQAGVRNQFKGRVTEIVLDGVMAQVTVLAGEQEITSIMTKESLQQADFKVGDEATALIKAVNVVLIK